MPALYLVITAFCVGAIAYRFYSAFIAAKVMVLDDSRKTPAHTKNDGSNYYPTSRWVLFGHHFSAIAGAGPLIGPVLAAQFGYAPGLIWLVAGVCLAGAVHDFITLWASTRRGGRSLADIARTEIGPVAGTIADSAWSTFMIGVTIPIGIAMGFHMFVFRKGKIREATIVGVILMIFAVLLGRPFANSSAGPYLV